MAYETGVAGLVCLAHQFHPTGKPEQLRVEHLRNLKTSTPIVQGERDSFGNKDKVATYELSEAVRVRWLPDGDHSFRPRKPSGRAEQENLAEAMKAVAKLAQSLPLN